LLGRQSGTDRPVFADAVAVAAGALERRREEFPESCPFTVEQLLTEGFLP
jgi:hypothetical protein